MKLEELTKLVALGEGATLEFKTKIPQPERIAKEVLAFANTKGGRVLIGVEDDGTIKGVRDSEEEDYILKQALGKHCDPPVEFETELIPVSKKREVILVRVPASLKKPHRLVTEEKESFGKVYVRVEDKSVEASREHIRIMKSHKKEGNVVFEFGAKEKVLMRYLEEYGRITVMQFAKLVGIPSRRASHTLVLLTKANVLQFHADPKSGYFTLAY